MDALLNFLEAAYSIEWMIVAVIIGAVCLGWLTRADNLDEPTHDEWGDPIWYGTWQEWVEIASCFGVFFVFVYFFIGVVYLAYGIFVSWLAG